MEKVNQALAVHAVITFDKFIAALNSSYDCTKNSLKTDKYCNSERLILAIKVS
jgi:hypothetical protein